jgi:hypothetical protein
MLAYAGECWRMLHLGTQAPQHLEAGGLADALLLASKVIDVMPEVYGILEILACEILWG